MREQHPNALVATYINCNAETKAESDIIVTSSNAETVIEASERQTDHFCTG
jgi:quinolinate synthase